MIEKFDAKDLLEKFSAGKCTADEEQAVRYWLHTFRSGSETSYSADDLEAISKELWTKIEMATVPTKISRPSIWPRIAAAAAVLLFIVAAFYFLPFRKTGTDEIYSVYKNDVQPGGNRAYLILADGKKINLDTLRGALNQPGVHISKGKDGTLTYVALENTRAADQENTIKTPNGGKFKVSLPDGTTVWLNAASSLSYPLSFKGSAERIVKLVGEGYFEVFHDSSHPFIVQSAGQSLKVLGTHFNLKAYGEENQITTTLLSGSVKVYAPGLNSSKILKPGEQSAFDSSRFTLSPGDTEQATAWVNDDFVFNGEDLHGVMRQIARWYDVDVEYTSQKDDAVFYSTISRKKKLSEILKALTLNQGVHFKLEGRRVTVMP